MAEGDAPVFVEPDHARGDGGQDGIEEPAPLFDLAVGGEERVPLGAELAGHLVEDPAKHGDFVVALLFPDLHVQIPCPDPLGGAREAAHGLREAFGEPEPPENGGEDQDDGEADVEKAEFEDEAAPFVFKLVVEAGRFLGIVEKPEDAGVHVAGDVEKPVGKS